MSNGGKRDLVRFESNERVDLPDLDAVQANARSESRMTVDTLITGQGVNLWSTAYATFGVNPNRPQLSRWEIQTSATQITVFAGLAIGGLLDPAADTETGVWFGGDGDASQTIDLAAKPDGDYGIYVKPVFDAGLPGTRIFWDTIGNTETAQSIDTRRLFGWTTNVELLTSPDDGESVIVGYVQITGGAITTLEEWYAPLFEAGFIRDVLLGSTGNVVEWWRNLAFTDPTLRDPALAHTNPVTNLADFAAVVRSQVADILGLTGAAYWRSARPETATANTTGAIGTPVSLTIARDHIDLSTDPHGPDLTQTGEITTEDLTVNGEATFENGSVTDFESGSTVNVRGGAVVSVGNNSAQIELPAMTNGPGDRDPALVFDGPTEQASSMSGAAVASFFSMDQMADYVSLGTPSDRRNLVDIDHGATGTPTGYVSTEGIPVFWIPLSILGVPHGATITSFGFAGFALSGGVSDIEMQIIETSRLVAASTTQLGPASDSGENVTLNDRSFGHSLLVKNRSSDYSIRVEMNGSGGGQCRLYGIFVNWTIPAPIPEGVEVLV